MKYLDDINRGGLIKPSALSFSIGLKSYQVFECVASNSDLRKYLLKAPRQQSAMTKLIVDLLEEDVEFNEIAVNVMICNSGHNFAESLVNRVVKCMCQNFIKKMYDDRVVSDSNRRGLRKLQGKTSGMDV